MTSIQNGAKQIIRAASQDLEAASTRFYRVADQSLCLRFASENLLPYIAPAISHLESSTELGPIDLRVSIVDPSVPGSEDFLIEAEELGKSFEDAWLFRGDEVIAFQSPFGKGLYLLDWSEREAVFVSREGTLDQQQSGSPLLSIFHWWMARQGYLLVHSAAIGKPERGAALLTGKGGSGKSTTALSSLRSNMGFIGEDYCLISRNSGEVFSLYSSGKLTERSFEQLPFLKPALSEVQHPEADKHLLNLFPLFSDKIIYHLPARVVLIPRVRGKSESGLTRTSASQGLRALAPSTLFQFRFSEDPHGELAAMQKMVSSLPTYYLDLGRDPDQIHKLIEDLLDENTLLE